MNTWNRLFFGVINVGRSTAKTVGSLASLHIFEKALQLHSPGSFFLAIPPCFLKPLERIYIPLQKWTQNLPKCEMSFCPYLLIGPNYQVLIFGHHFFDMFGSSYSGFINRWDRRFQGASAFKLQVANLAVAPIALEKTERWRVQKSRVLVFGPPPRGNENNGWICLGPYNSRWRV